MESEVCGVERVVKGMYVIDGAGVKLRRIIGSSWLDNIDPFVLLDEFKSDNPDDYIAGFPWHPHRGIETITYMMTGKFRHQDSKSGGGILTPGTVQWMTAGRGILHSEMPEMFEGLLWGYQLWLTLPKKDKMVPPKYQHISKDMIPSVNSNGLEVKIISGKYKGQDGPADTWFPISYFDVSLRQKATFKYAVSENMNKFFYIHTGSIIVDPAGVAKEVESGDLVILGKGTDIEITGVGPENGMLFFAGVPHNEPIVKGGPFVMNTRAEIIQAWEDYQNGKIFQ
jgi:redox-sensitive bicupin YhaK (pirin superfamily)